MEILESEKDEQTPELRNEVFKCGLCEMNYKTKSGLNKHMGKHQSMAQIDGNVSFTEEKQETESDEASNLTKTRINVKVKVAAHSFDDANNTVKANLLYILDAKVEPVHLQEESTFDMEETESNVFPHIFVLKAALPEDIVFVDENETRSEWRNNKGGFQTQIKDFLIM